MRDDELLKKLDGNYDNLEEDKKDKLLTIGEKLLDIQNAINSEKLTANNKGNKKRKN